MTDTRPITGQPANAVPDEGMQDPKQDAEHESLKYHLLGPSLTKAGQDSVDQSKVWKAASWQHLLAPQPC